MITFRNANEDDVHLYFDWANDQEVRLQSYNSEFINYEDHANWFLSKLKDKNCFLLVFQDNNENIGQVRFQIEKKDQAIIGVSIEKDKRGMGYASTILNISTIFFLNKYPHFTINAYIKETNIASRVVFKKAGFKEIGFIKKNNHKSFHLIKLYE